MAKKTGPNPYAGLLTDRHKNETVKCLGNCDFAQELMDKAERTGMDVGPGREALARQRERLQRYRDEFFPEQAAE